MLRVSKYHIEQQFYQLLCIYGRDTRSAASREEYKLQMFEDRVLREIYGPKKNEVDEQCRILQR
jgi:hypothetical protein